MVESIEEFGGASMKHKIMGGYWQCIRCKRLSISIIWGEVIMRLFHLPYCEVCFTNYKSFVMDSFKH